MRASAGEFQPRLDAPDPIGQAVQPQALLGHDAAQVGDVLVEHGDALFDTADTQRQLVDLDVDAATLESRRP